MAQDITTPSARTVDAFTITATSWGSGDAGRLTVRDALVVADLLSELGRKKAAFGLLVNAWCDSDHAARDAKPWFIDGKRYAAPPAGARPRAEHFVPRPDTDTPFKENL